MCDIPGVTPVTKALSLILLNLQPLNSLSFMSLQGAVTPVFHMTSLGTEGIQKLKD